MGSSVTSRFAAFIIVALISKALRWGKASRTILIAPAVIGLENEVPLIGVKPSPLPGSAVRISVPGAVISGFKVPAIEGPRDVNVAIAPAVVTSVDEILKATSPAARAALIASPSSFDTITDGIVMLSSSPPITMVPAALFATTTNDAPLS